MKQAKAIMAKKSSMKNANASNKMYKGWRIVENTKFYRKAATRETCQLVTRRIEAEVLEGIFLNLNERYASKSSSVQSRVLRRIVEKRQAQANHRKNGRSAGLEVTYITRQCTKVCLADINKKRWAA